jgi:hypothetical protein
MNPISHSYSVASSYMSYRFSGLVKSSKKNNNNKTQSTPYIYCNKRILLLTHTLILNVCVTMSMHGFHTSTQHLDETLEPLNYIRVHPSCCHKHSHKRSHVLYCVSCNIIQDGYMSFIWYICT